MQLTFPFVMMIQDIAMRGVFLTIKVGGPFEEPDTEALWFINNFQVGPFHSDPRHQPPATASIFYIPVNDERCVRMARLGLYVHEH